METLNVYHDGESQRAVLRFCRDAAKHEAFLKALAGAVVKQGSSVAKLSRRQAHAVLTWSCVALERLDPAAAKKVRA